MHDALEELYKVLHNVAYGLLGCEKSKSDHNSWQVLPPTGGVYPHDLACRLATIPALVNGTQQK